MSDQQAPQERTPFDPEAERVVLERVKARHVHKGDEIMCCDILRGVLNVRFYVEEVGGVSLDLGDRWHRCPDGDEPLWRLAARLPEQPDEGLRRAAETLVDEVERRMPSEPEREGRVAWGYEWEPLIVPCERLRASLAARLPEQPDDGRPLCPECGDSNVGASTLPGPPMWRCFCCGHLWPTPAATLAARPTVPEEPDEGRKARLVEKSRALAAGEPCPSCGMRHADPLDLLEEPGA